MKKTGRNDPCPCESGLKYKHCHGPILEARPRYRVPMAQSIYSRQWQKNGAHYAAQGYYQWMALQIKPYSPKRILDIGCGEGSGILELLRTFSQAEDLSIISLEENSSCIHAARDGLKSSGFQAKVVSRIVIEPVCADSHLLKFQPNKIGPAERLMLIEADVLSDDPELADFLSNLAPFDAVTSWLIGTHDTRYECLNFAPVENQNSYEYKLRVQNKVYKLADLILKSGGILHLVDRGEFPWTPQLAQDFALGYQQQASHTNMRVQSFDFREYAEFEGKGGRRMGVTLPTTGRDADMSKIAFHSCILVKP